MSMPLSLMKNSDTAHSASAYLLTLCRLRASPDSSVGIPACYVHRLYTRLELGIKVTFPFEWENLSLPSRTMRIGKLHL
jgi:hypothetical protein